MKKVVKIVASVYKGKTKLGYIVNINGEEKMISMTALEEHLSIGAKI